MPGVWACVFFGQYVGWCTWLPSLWGLFVLVVRFRADAPFPMFLGEVLSDFRDFW